VLISIPSINPLKNGNKPDYDNITCDDVYNMHRDKILKKRTELIKTILERTLYNSKISITGVETVF